jgi:hypothetical protein
MIKYIWLSLIIETVIGTDFEPCGEIDALGVSKVLVIPDTHGDAKTYLGSLYLAYREIEGSEIDEVEFNAVFVDAIYNHVIPFIVLSRNTDVVLVQLGDMVDRGPYSEECILITRAIPKVLGWRTVSLFGNHELLSIMGRSNLYIHPDEAKAFEGIDGRNEAFSPEGAHNPLFEDLKENSIAIARLHTRGRWTGGNRDPNTLFVHGGIDLGWIMQNFNPSLPFQEIAGVPTINHEFKRALESPEGREKLSEDESFLWTRTLAEAEEEIACPLADEINTRFQVSRIIVGHTPQYDRRVKTRCNGKIILADAMMSSYMDPTNPDYPAGNRLVIVLTLHAGELTGIDAIYSYHREPLLVDTISQRGITRPAIPNSSLTRSRTYTNLASIMDEHEDAIFVN